MAKYQKKGYKKKSVNRKMNVKSLINREITKRLDKTVEYKAWDVQNTWSSTPVAYRLSAINVGTGDNDRVGDQIKCKNIQLKLYGLLGGATSPINFRIILFRTNEVDSTSPTVANILQDTTTGPRIYNSPWNLDNMRAGRYTILMDKSLSVNLDTPSRSLNKYINLKSRIDYLSGATTGKGNIYVLLLSDYVTGSLPTINFYSRLMYTDA